jgi:nucleoside-diphosphate-sugar epimerase
MKVLITGAAGFLGRKFLEYHKSVNDTVFAVDDFSNAEPVPGFPIMQSDAASFLHDFDMRMDLAYHFAAPVGGRLKIEGDPLFNADSLRLDSEFFRWAVQFATTAIYPSSSAVYGVDYQGEGGMALGEGLFSPEDTRWSAPDEMYGFTKMAGEVLAFKAAKYGLNTLCIRPFSGYGGTQSLQYPIPSICLRALNQEDPLTVWGSGYQTRDFIHVDDLVTTTIKAVRRGIFGYETLNIGSGIPTSFVDVARLAAELVGYAPIIVTDATKPQGVSQRYADTARMRKIHTPTITLKDGLAEVLEALTHGKSHLARQGAHD